MRAPNKAKAAVLITATVVGLGLSWTASLTFSALSFMQDQVASGIASNPFVETDKDSLPIFALAWMIVLAAIYRMIAPTVHDTAQAVSSAPKQSKATLNQEQAFERMVKLMQQQDLKAERVSRPPANIFDDSFGANMRRGAQNGDMFASLGKSLSPTAQDPRREQPSLSKSSETSDDDVILGEALAEVMAAQPSAKP